MNIPLQLVSTSILGYLKFFRNNFAQVNCYPKQNPFNTPPLSCSSWLINVPPAIWRKQKPSSSSKSSLNGNIGKWLPTKITGRFILEIQNKSLFPNFFCSVRMPRKSQRNCRNPTYGFINDTTSPQVGDLFGMVKIKWPFGKAKWPPTMGWNGQFEAWITWRTLKSCLFFHSPMGYFMVHSWFSFGGVKLLEINYCNRRIESPKYLNQDYLTNHRLKSTIFNSSASGAICPKFLSHQDLIPPTDKQSRTNSRQKLGKKIHPTTCKKTTWNAKCTIF